jgi:hypothetical protein
MAGGGSVSGCVLVAPILSNLTAVSSLPVFWFVDTCCPTLPLLVLTGHPSGHS